MPVGKAKVRHQFFSGLHSSCSAACFWLSPSLIQNSCSSHQIQSLSPLTLNHSTLLLRDAPLAPTAHSLFRSSAHRLWIRVFPHGPGSTTMIFHQAFIPAEELGQGGALVCAGSSFMIKRPGARMHCRMHQLSPDAACGKPLYQLCICK